jgi:hypothetical protein
MSVKPNDPYPELDEFVEKVIVNADSYFNVGCQIKAAGGGREYLLGLAPNWEDAYTMAQILEGLRKQIDMADKDQVIG